MQRHGVRSRDNVLARKLLVDVDQTLAGSFLPDPLQNGPGALRPRPSGLAKQALKTRVLR